MNNSGSRIKVFIFGSCVSRDPFEFADDKDFKVVNYYARSSLASLGAKPYIDKKILSEIDSKWQKRMVLADMDKSVFDALLSDEYDLILLDLIDERFNLAVTAESVHTISSEYKKALYKPNSYLSIKSNSDEKMELWLKGFGVLAEFLRNNNLSKKLVVNKVRWTLKGVGGDELLRRYKIEDIDSANFMLDAMYAEIERKIPEAKFIEYLDSDLEVDKGHKWGLEPFHYNKKACYRQLASLYAMSLRDISFVLRHELGNVSMSFPIKWRENPKENRSWMHNFISLRWLDGGYFFVQNVLMSFYNYHCVKKIKNPYYDSVRGDHSAAIRLGVFFGLRERFSNAPFVGLVSLVNKLIAEEIKNLQTDKIYRAGHNHGLMVDIAIIKALLIEKKFESLVDIAAIQERSASTLDQMWDRSGLTKEHSISYQEYNLPLTIEYFELMRKLDLEVKCQVRPQDIIEESKRLLGFALKRGGEYFPMGDSFRVPNRKIINQMYGQDEFGDVQPYQLLLPYSDVNGHYVSDRFFIYRGMVKAHVLHFCATSCWDSGNHKQNDELSFCLTIDGVDVFDDPGYTEFADWETVMFLKSEDAHTNFSIAGKKWSDATQVNGRSTMKAEVTQSGFNLRMTCERVAGVVFNRVIVLKDNIVEIEDSVDLSDSMLDADEWKVRSRFILSKHINPEFVDAENGRSIRLLAESLPPIEFCQILPGVQAEEVAVPYVESNRSVISTTKSLVYSYNLTDSACYKIVI